MCDPDTDYGNRDSVMQDHHNNPSCSSDVSDHSISNHGQCLDKVVYDEQHDTLIARTNSGQYITYKCNHTSDGQYSEELYQMLNDSFFVTLNKQYIHDLCETNDDVMHDPRYVKGMDYINRVIMKCGIT